MVVHSQPQTCTVLKGYIVHHCSRVSSFLGVMRFLRVGSLYFSTTSLKQLPALGRKRKEDNGGGGGGEGGGRERIVGVDL